MDILTTPDSVNQWSREQARQGLRVALVPTMGFFHDGHLSLMRRARSLADRVVVSLFVNPTQFGPGEDLAAYPRNFDRDARLAEAEGVDVLFAPVPEAVYPEGFSTKVSVEMLSNSLCGASRPGHFQGVATVVCKLFNMVEPDVAVFGEKDFQQLMIIRRMARDLNFHLEIIGHPIVREPDGLAMSSRNAYLAHEDRPSALCLSTAIELARSLAAGGELDAREIGRRVEEHILSHPKAVIDYVSLVDGETLAPVSRIDRQTILALAVRIAGKVRLIDNGFLFGQETRTPS